MSVRSILDQKGLQVFTIDQGAGIEQAAELMRERNIAALPVTKSGEVVGMLTSRDIVDGLARHGSHLFSLRAADLMRRDFARVSPADSARQVMTLMTRRRMTHIPVFSSGQLVGIVSIGDVVKHRLEDLEIETNVLRDVYIAAH